jgi:hypothetical protein
MTMKSVLVIATLAVGSIGVASAAKSYEFMLSSPVKAGNIDLKPGAYKVRIDGTQATFINSDGHKSAPVTVRLEHGSAKFDQTMVQIGKKNGVDSIQEIQLGGSDTKVELGEPVSGSN